MSDYYRGDGRPGMFGKFPGECTVSEAVYVYHHAGLVGLEVGDWTNPGVNPPGQTITLALSPTQARYVARALLDRAKDLDGQTD